MADLKELNTKLHEAKLPEPDIKKFLGYVSGAQNDEAKKDANKRPVSSNDLATLYGLFVKYHNMGLVIDGVNVVITGKNMAMVTYHGYKNKVLSVYPETEFDIQLVRKGDMFTVGKESGSIIYSHSIADPFGNPPIIGAYVIFKNKRGEYIETLNKDDFERMKKASRQSYLWGEWESEFWLKSVIKRACKRHFFDVVAEIDKNDNDNFGLLVDKDPEQPKRERLELIEKHVKAIGEAKTLEELKVIFVDTNMLTEPAIVAAKDARKAELVKEGEDVKA